MVSESATYNSRNSVVTDFSIDQLLKESHAIVKRSIAFSFFSEIAKPSKV
jgi:hypothetical protein